MARPLRIQFENAYYHVTCRGNARQSIFSTDADRLAFLDLLGRSSEVYRTEVLAYVLMSNHFHLLVKTPLGNLQEFMRHFNISYTAFFNRRHRRSGHLYQGRYHSLLIDADHYLKEVSRYIHLNPVKIKQTRSKDYAARKKILRSYGWSSYPGYVARSERRPFLRVEEVLDYFGGDTTRGRRSYTGFVEQGLVTDLGNPLELGKGHGIIGERGFVEGVRERYVPSAGTSREQPAVGKLQVSVEPDQIVAAVCAVLNVERGDLLRKGNRGPGRGLLMEMLYRYGGMKQKEIGRMLGIDYSAVSIGRKRFLIMTESDPKLLSLFAQAKDRISQG
jgi:REP element-mobilizing transposase RayT